METTITIRPAGLNDATSLRELATNAFVKAYGEHNTPTDMSAYIEEHFSRENMVAELFDPGILFLLAFDHHELVGYAKLMFRTDYDVDAKRPIEIARLYTKVELIGKGIGKKLIHEISDYAKQKGFDAICLGVWQKNPGAVRFYAREGFVIAGTTTFVLGTDVQDDYIMIKNLN